MPTPPKKTPWWKLLLKIVAFLIVAVITLAALFLAWNSFTGRRELAKVKRELLARGEKLSLSEFIPPPVPPADNFYADPLWEELYPADITKSSEPRVPKGGRQLDALTRTAPNEGLEKRAAEYPEFPLPEPLYLPAFVRKLAAEGKKAAPGQQRRAAELILAAIASVEPVPERIAWLARRPGASFPFRYDDTFFMRFESASELLTIGQLFAARIWAESVLGDREAAFADTRTLLRLAEVNAQEPLLIIQLIRLSVESMALEAIADGLKVHLWTDADLAEFERRLAQTNFVPSLALSLRGERGAFNQFMEILRRDPKQAAEFFQTLQGPGFSTTAGALIFRFYGWTFASGDQAFYNRQMQEWIDTVERAPQEGLNPRPLSGRNIAEIKADMKKAIPKISSMLTLPTMAGTARRFALTQDQVTLTRVACALERYRLAHGDYPDTLSALVPEFLETLPVDVVILQPVRYRKDNKEGFLLWTPGWNEKDDGGIETTRTKDADWLWGKPNRGK